MHRLLKNTNILENIHRMVADENKSEMGKIRGTGIEIIIHLCCFISNDI